VKKQLKAFFGDTFYPLLLAQVAFILLLPAVDSSEGLHSVFTAIGLSIILMLGTRVIENKKFRHGTFIIALLFAVLIAIKEIYDYPRILLGNFVLFFVAIVFVTTSIIRRLLRSPDVKLSLIAGSIAGYLMIAFTLAFFLLMLSGFVEPVLNLPMAEIHFQGVLYFALINIATIGFGDIAPMHPMAQNITALAGVFSQFYMAVVVAVIVGKVMSERRNPANKHTPGNKTMPHI
jgi:hypothetical protein